MYIQVSAANGRVYKNEKEILASWNAGHSFIILSVAHGSGSHINKEGAQRAGFSEVNVRYKGHTKVMVIKV